MVQAKGPRSMKVSQGVVQGVSAEGFDRVWEDPGCDYTRSKKIQEGLGGSRLRVKDSQR